MNKRVGFLNNNNRLCVAFSRAKRLLITVGDSKTVAHDGNNIIIEPLNELLNRSRQEDIGYYETL
jgi:superfamily I DNA and/or RNA helicase